MPPRIMTPFFFQHLHIFLLAKDLAYGSGTLRQTPLSICPWFGFGTADMVGMSELNGWVGHHGRNGC